MGYGLEFPDVVDLVGVFDEKREVVLIITGPEVWTDSAQERELLTRKLESYLLFVESGQLGRSYRQTAGFSVHFQIDTTTALPESLRSWIQHFADVLIRDHGVELHVTRI